MALTIDTGHTDKSKASETSGWSGPEDGEGLSCEGSLIVKTYHPNGNIKSIETTYATTNYDIDGNLIVEEEE